MSSELSYEDVSRILNLLDVTRGEDLEFTLGGHRVAVTSWRDEPMAIASQTTNTATGTTDDTDGGATPDTKGVRGCLVEPAFTDVRAQRPGIFQGSTAADRQVLEGELLGRIAGHGGTHDALLAIQDGRIAEVCVNEGDFVEYDQVIFVIEKNPAHAVS